MLFSFQVSPLFAMNTFRCNAGMSLVGLQKDHMLSMFIVVFVGSALCDKIMTTAWPWPCGEMVTDPLLFLARPAQKGLGYDFKETSWNSNVHMGEQVVARTLPGRGSWQGSPWGRARKTINCKAPECCAGAASGKDPWLPERAGAAACGAGGHAPAL